MNEKQFLFMLSLCRRAGDIIIGTPMVTSSLGEGKIKLVIYSALSSENTAKKITDKCAFYNVEALKIDTPPDVIAHAIGKSGAVCAVGITNLNFSEQLKKLTTK